MEPEPFLKIYPEFRVPPDQVKAWLADRQGAIVGRDLADTFRLEGRRSDSADRHDLAAEAGTGLGLQPRRHLRRRRRRSTRRSSSFGTTISTRTGPRERDWSAGTSCKIADPSQAVALSRTFDEMFANSSAETKTTTEKGFIEGFAKQIGDIGAIMIAISSVVLFMFGLVAASTMAQSVRERTSELAVLKTLGFTGGAILALVLAESLFIVLVGGGPRARDRLAVRAAGRSDGRHAADLRLPPRDVAIGVALMVAMGLLAGAAPALGAMRLRITDALRRV